MLREKKERMESISYENVRISDKMRPEMNFSFQKNWL